MHDLTFHAGNPRPEFESSVASILVKKPQLHKQGMRALRQLFNHPVAHDIRWPSVHTLIRDAGGSCNATAHQKLHVEINGVRRVFDMARGPLLQTSDVMHLRRFITEALLNPAPSRPEILKRTALLVMERSHATLYRLWLLPLANRDHFARPDAGDAVTIIPAIDEGVEVPDNRRHVIQTDEERKAGRRDKVRGHSRKSSTTEVNLHNYFNRVTEALNPVERVLILGQGAGHANVADLYFMHLRKHRMGLRDKVVTDRPLRVDTRSMSQMQLLQFAREKLQNIEATAASPTP